MARLKSCLKMLDQRFSEPEFEHQYIQSLQPDFVIPTIANIVFGLTCCSYYLFGLGLLDDEEALEGAGRLLKSKPPHEPQPGNGTLPHGKPQGKGPGWWQEKLDGADEVGNFATIIFTIVLYMVMLAMLTMKQCTNLLKSISNETIYVIWGCVLIEGFCWGNRYTLSSLAGETSQEDLSDATCLIALELSAVTAVVCLLVPIRSHLSCLVALLSILSFVVQLCLCGTAMEKSLPRIMLMFILLMFVSIYGSCIHDKYRREKWLAERKIRTLEKLSKGKDCDAYVAEAVVQRSSLESDIIHQLPDPDRLRICILGGTKFNEASSEIVVKALAKKFCERLSNVVVVLTGGMPGVQQAFAQSLGANFGQVHLLPEGKSSDFGVGKDVIAGHDLPERMHIFGSLGHVYVCIEGGPGVAKEAKQAFERGAVVLPVMSTGGASSGMFDFPQGALKKPDSVTDDQWSMMKAQGDPDATATAMTDVILGIVEKQRVICPL